MKYFLDTEFLEGTQKEMKGKNLIIFAALLFFIVGLVSMYAAFDVTSYIYAIAALLLGIIYIVISKKIYSDPTINLISIGMVSEDNRELYLISKEFNIKEAWYRYQIGKKRKVYWIRENVLKPIHEDLSKRAVDEYKGMADPYYALDLEFNYINFQRLVKQFGETNSDIADKIKEFCDWPACAFDCDDTKMMWHVRDKYVEEELAKMNNPTIIEDTEPMFYAYFADYDWVAFCWLFGKMIDLPSNFPMYCKDLKQLMEEHFIITEDLLDYCESVKKVEGKYPTNETLKYVFKTENIKMHPYYPKNKNAHDALSDAKWNKELYEFLNKL